MKTYRFTGYGEKTPTKNEHKNAQEFKRYLDSINVGDWLGYDKENKAYLVKCPVADGVRFKNAYYILDMNTNEVYSL